MSAAVLEGQQLLHKVKLLTSEVRALQEKNLRLEKRERVARAGGGRVNVHKVLRNCAQSSDRALLRGFFYQWAAIARSRCKISVIYTCFFVFLSSSTATSHVQGPFVLNNLNACAGGL